MNNQHRRNLGDDIRNTVQNALNNGDFKRLNKDIEDIVRGALGEVKRSINPQGISKQTQNNQFNNVNLYRQRTSQRNLPLRRTKYTVPVGKTSGILLTIFGALVTTAFGISVFVLVLLGNTVGGKGILNAIAIGLLPLLIISAISLFNGNRIRKRLKRFQKYIDRMRNSDYYLIRELSSITGLSEKATAKDLRKMIAVGMFPEGHVDEKGNYFILSNQAYEEYIKFKENLKLKQLEEHQKNKVQKSIEEGNKKNNKLDPEVKKVIDEGRQFVIEIKNANIAIPGEEISRKLDRLEEVTGKIFDYIEIHPEKLHEIKKFMDYFLPTTLKLLDAYRKLDYQSIEGRNISSSKKEIEDTIDTINQAFENLLDDLFEDLAMDISTDITVLETLFAQEGLLDNDIIVRNKIEEEEK